jgi:hypothetical protein
MENQQQIENQQPAVQEKFSLSTIKKYGFFAAALGALPSTLSAAVDLSAVQTELTTAFSAVLTAFTAIFGEYTVLIVSIAACFILLRSFM